MNCKETEVFCLYNPGLYWTTATTIVGLRRNIIPDYVECLRLMNYLFNVVVFILFHTNLFEYTKHVRLVFNETKI